MSSHSVGNVEEIYQLLEAGTRNRATGATNMNAVSSRSHSLFQIIVELMENNTQPEQKKVKVKFGKLNMVDYAGSERVSKAGSKGARFKEMTKINLSLSTLCQVISSLTSAN